PIVSQIEIRKEGKIGRVYYPAPYMDNDNLEYFEDAYEIGFEKIIDTYAEATQHVAQGLSLTLFFKDTATTRAVNKAQIYAWRKGVNTLVSSRLREMALECTEVEGCVSGMLCRSDPEGEGGLPVFRMPALAHAVQGRRVCRSADGSSRRSATFRLESPA